LAQQLTGFLCQRRVKAAFDLPAAEHLINYERAVAFDHDLSIAQLLLDEPFEDSNETGILSDVVGHEFALAVDLGAFPDRLVILDDHGTVGSSASWVYWLASAIEVSNVSH